jgi:hypothetical protein
MKIKKTMKNVLPGTDFIDEYDAKFILFKMASVMFIVIILKYGI